MDTRLDDAFAAVPRADFLPPDQRAFPVRLSSSTRDRF